jgi:hypothetical protein
MTVPFWLKEPTILLNQKYIKEIWCDSSMKSSQKLNAITRLVLILTTLGYMFTQNFNFVIMCILTLGIIVALHYYYLTKNQDSTIDGIIKEGFTNPSFYKAMEAGFTKPKPTNPLMNVTLPEITDNPTRKAAAPAYNPVVEKEINKAVKQQIITMHCDQPDIESKLFKDLGDNFDFEQSMRPFYATANTKLPNDQDAFAQFCYGNMPSCKEGDEFACTRDNARYINM